jgi:hypothetical protein
MGELNSSDRLNRLGDESGFLCFIANLSESLPSVRNCTSGLTVVLAAGGRNRFADHFQASGRSSRWITIDGKRDIGGPVAINADSSTQRRFPVAAAAATTGGRDTRAGCRHGRGETSKFVR